MVRNSDGRSGEPICNRFSKSSDLFLERALTSLTLILHALGGQSNTPKGCAIGLFSVRWSGSVAVLREDERMDEMDKLIKNDPRNASTVR